MPSDFLPRTECGITLPVFRSGAPALARTSTIHRTQVEVLTADAFGSTRLEHDDRAESVPLAVRPGRTREATPAPWLAGHKETAAYASAPDSAWHQEPPPHGSRSNLGAYGGTAQASKSL